MLSSGEAAGFLALLKEKDALIQQLQVPHTRSIANGI
jgi:hypothetical protein